MHSRSNNINFKSCNDANEVVFDSVQLIYYKCHKVNFKRGGLYIDSSDWIKKIKATINRKNTDDKCFQYAASLALNYKEIKLNPERVSNIKPFINRLEKNKLSIKNR